ncbi:hypothetical protein JCM10213_008498 [Rhodosporidiobolus nylandii]
MATLRQRRPFPFRALSSSAVLSSSSPIPSSPAQTDVDTDVSDAEGPSPTAAQRRRSHSLFASAAAVARGRSRSRSQALAYGSQLLESLDLPASLGGVREYLLEKLEELERGLGRLRELLDEEDEAEEDEGEKGGDEDDAEFATLEDDLSTLRSFVASASSFLSALRAELPSLPSSSSPNAPLVAFTLSPDARATLDAFLASHPFPSLPSLPAVPHYGVRARACESASAVLQRVAQEMEHVRSALAYLSASPSAAAAASYFPSLPSTSTMPDLHALRTHFSAESARFGAALAHLGADASDSLASGLHTLGDLAHAATDKAHDAIDEVQRMYHAALEAGKTRLLRYEELPLEWRNNEHLLDGYRYIPIESWGRLLRSGVEWHNETINIQSHFLGFLSLAILLFTYLLSPSPPHMLSNPHPGDTAIAVLFVLSAMHCLLCSAAWHLLAGCATSRWFRGAACVDYVGISGLIAASVMGAEYYGFREHPHLAAAYMCFSATVGALGMLVPWQAWFNQREYKMWRVAFFCSLAASAIAPIAHRAVYYGVVNTFWFYSPAIPSVAAYLVGLVFYSNQFPECCRPGSWNFGASHQWWHFSIVAAIYLHWRAMSIWSRTVYLAELAGVDSGVALGAH